MNRRFPTLLLVAVFLCAGCAAVKKANTSDQPPRGFNGIWRDGTPTSELMLVSLYLSGERQVTDYFLRGRPWMRVTYKGGGGAACGYEYRFAPGGAVTYICTYLPDKPGEPIVIFQPSHHIDLRRKYPDVLKKYAPFSRHELPSRGVELSTIPLS